MGFPEADLVLPEFEGPLDLLLHLLRKHELDLFNIPIAFVTARYLETLEAMRSLNVDIAGEYLLMAASLAHLKSRELLPVEARAEVAPDNPEEGEDPRQALIDRLLQYQRYKQAALFLASRPVMGKNVFPRGEMPPPPADLHAPLAEVPVWELVRCLSEVLKQGPRHLAHEVSVERLSLADRILDVCALFETRPDHTFLGLIGDLLRTGEGSDEVGYQVVVTFMAVLELTRLRLLSVHQADEAVRYTDILIRRVEGAILPRHAPNIQGELPFSPNENPS